MRFHRLFSVNLVNNRDAITRFFLRDWREIEGIALEIARVRFARDLYAIFTSFSSFLFTLYFFSSICIFTLKRFLCVKLYEAELVEKKMIFNYSTFVDYKRLRKTS